MQSTSGVKKVVDHVAIGPVTLDSNFVLKQKADSVLARHVTIISKVKAGLVTLSGAAKTVEAETILKDVDKLPVAGVQNEINIQD